MYRLFPLLVLGSAAAAPPLPDYDVTYLKMEPQISDRQPSTHVPLVEPYHPSPQSSRAAPLTTKQYNELSSTPSQDLTTELPETSTDVTGSSETTTEIHELVSTASTESYERADSVLGQSENHETVNALPKFIPKLSYFGKSYGFDDDHVPNNLVEKPFKKKFKSKCRCERIWNCPKLQITVPRCPTEYFMCCF